MPLCVCVHAHVHKEGNNIVLFFLLNVGDLWWTSCMLTLPVRCLAGEGVFVIWVRWELNKTTHLGHPDPQVCAPPSLAISAVLETSVVWAGFVYGFAEFMAGEHCPESFQGSDLLVYPLSHADCEEKKQLLASQNQSEVVLSYRPKKKRWTPDLEIYGHLATHSKRVLPSFWVLQLYLIT